MESLTAALASFGACVIILIPIWIIKSHIKKARFCGGNTEIVTVIKIYGSAPELAQTVRSVRAGNPIEIYDLGADDETLRICRILSDGAENITFYSERL